MSLVGLPRTVAWMPKVAVVSVSPLVGRDAQTRTSLPTKSEDAAGQTVWSVSATLGQSNLEWNADGVAFTASQLEDIITWCTDSPQLGLERSQAQRQFFGNDD